MNPGMFWFMLPNPYTSHEPRLGFGNWVEPVISILAAIE
jgi:hypothetical protein